MCSKSRALQQICDRFVGKPGTQAQLTVNCACVPGFPIDCCTLFKRRCMINARKAVGPTVLASISIQLPYVVRSGYLASHSTWWFLVPRKPHTQHNLIHTVVHRCSFSWLKFIVTTDNASGSSRRGTCM